MSDATNFSLTGLLAKETHRINNDAKEANTIGGRLGARFVNLVTCPTAFLDTVGHLATAALTLCTGAGVIGSFINLCAGRKISPITIGGGFTNILQAIKHAAMIIGAPITGLISPTALSKCFNAAEMKAEQEAKEAMAKMAKREEEIDNDYQNFLNELKAEAREEELVQDYYDFVAELRAESINDDYNNFVNELEKADIKKQQTARQAEIDQEYSNFVEELRSEERAASLDEDYNTFVAELAEEIARDKFLKAEAEEDEIGAGIADFLNPVDNRGLPKKAFDAVVGKTAGAIGYVANKTANVAKGFLNLMENYGF